MSNKITAAIFTIILILLPMSLTANTCLDFDGVDDFIDVTSSTVVQGAFTVEAWVKPMHPTDNLNILSTRSGSDNSFDMKLKSGNQIHGDIGNGTTWLTNTADANFVYETGKWYHIAYSVSATGYEIFANGTSVGSGTWPSNTPLLMDATHQINIGRYNGGLEYFKGTIDEVRIWNIARTGQEIQNNMLHSLLGTETGLVAYYGFDEAGGITAGDSAGSNDGTLTNMAEEDWVLSYCFNPQIKSLSPADNSQDVTISENLEITFDRNILAGTGNVVIHKSSDDSIVETIPASSCAIVDSIVTIDPSGDFEDFTGFYVLIDNTAFMDNDSVYFEGIVEKTVWDFGTKNYFTDISAGLTNVSYGSSTWGDYDNDGDLDLVITGYTGSAGSAKIYRNNAGVFNDISAELTGVYYGSSAWGDYDNDGDLDLMITGIEGTTNIAKIYRNDAGTFVDIAAGLTSVKFGSSAWGDYDNDGDLDLIITGYTGSANIAKIYRNDAGTFVDIAASLTGVSSCSSSEWGDYDNDGDLDLIITGYTGSANTSKIYRNDDGTFTDIAAGLIGVSYGTSKWGDYDNDGDLDLIITGSTGSVNIAKIYRNDAGVFNDISAGLTGVYQSSVEWGDYDNDGDLDILLTGSSGAGYISKIYRNDNEIFSDIVAGLTGVNNSSVAWGDYDNDGDLDILLTGYSDAGYITKIYRNDGGIFTDISAGLTGLYYGSVAWGDYDNDGDLDILLTGSSGAGYISKIYRNNCVTLNTSPVKPTKLVTIVENDSLKLSFNPTTDVQTPQAGLSYNLRLNINGSNAKPSMSDTETGYRRVVETGNLCQVTKYAIPYFGNLPQEEKSFSWGVQAIDHCFAGSEFASSTELVLSSPRDLILASNSLMAESDVLKWEYINTEITDHYVIQIDDDSYFRTPYEKSYFLDSKEEIKEDKTLFFTIQLNEFDSINDLIDEQEYYWRIKPVYNDSTKISIFSENPKIFMFSRTTYYPPSSISIEAVSDSITVSWSAKGDAEKGEVYNVYSSNDPYAVFPEGWKYEANVNGNQWLTTASELKKFYCVTATGTNKIENVREKVEIENKYSK